MVRLKLFAMMYLTDAFRRMIFWKVFLSEVFSFFRVAPSGIFHSVNESRKNNVCFPPLQNVELN